MTEHAHEPAPTLPELGIDLVPLETADPAMAGDIQLWGRIGEGGMGRVYLGLTPAGRPVAVKMVKDPFAGDPAFRARFAREATLAARVNGLYTAPVLRYEADADRPWLATAFVPGPTLAVAVTRHGTLPVQGVWKLAAGIAEALKAIHAAGITHRDLKPGNVLLATDGPRVIDFGIARADGVQDGLTQTGVRMGTPAYMAPEQLRGDAPGPGTDVFALGSVIAYAAGGTAPFRGRSEAELIYRITQGEPDLGAVPDEGLRRLVAACLAKDPADRPTPDAVIEAYGRARRGPAPVGGSWLPAGLADTLAAAGAAAVATLVDGSTASPRPEGLAATVDAAAVTTARPAAGAGTAPMDDVPPATLPGGTAEASTLAEAGAAPTDGVPPATLPGGTAEASTLAEAGAAPTDGAPPATAPGRTAEPSKLADAGAAPTASATVPEISAPTVATPDLAEQTPTSALPAAPPAPDVPADTLIDKAVDVGPAGPTVAGAATAPTVSAVREAVTVQSSAPSGADVEAPQIDRPAATPPPPAATLPVPALPPPPPRRTRRTLLVLAAVTAAVVLLFAGYLASGLAGPRGTPGASATPGPGGAVGGTPSATRVAEPGGNQIGTSQTPGTGPGATPVPGGQVPGATTGPGGNPSQRPPESKPVPGSGLPNGPFNPADAVIVSAQDGAVLSATGTGSGAAVATRAWRNQPGQRWTFAQGRDANGRRDYVVVPRNATAMQLSRNFDNNVQLGTWEQDWQRSYWNYDPQTRRIENAATNICLVGNGPDQQVSSDFCSGAANQQWRLVS
ncbi:protein kinase [Longispora sp. NPDC051575]|uniref:protein kinase domain-containing protein n=1 Tax=Longispora sp. NPDC051575 TaxID=3154943 RepID=UPI003417DCA6